MAVEILAGYLEGDLLVHQSFETLDIASKIHKFKKDLPVYHKTQDRQFLKGIKSANASQNMRQAVKMYIE